MTDPNKEAAHFVEGSFPLQKRLHPLSEFREKENKWRGKMRDEEVNRKDEVVTCGKVYSSTTSGRGGDFGKTKTPTKQGLSTRTALIFSDREPSETAVGAGGVRWGGEASGVCKGSELLGF